MLTLKATTRFKKDYKRMKKSEKKNETAGKEKPLPGRFMYVEPIMRGGT